ncbi:MAG TPA: cysteine synthase A, partial [Myxococcota bacterium]|nr:cysteine synthase A [Myxococcota bacterium]
MHEKPERILDLIGNTPMLRIPGFAMGDVFAKAEFLNAGGSVKDRIAKHMLDCAEAEGKLKPGMTIIESTSGNTGIGITLCGVQKGYRVIIVMPENMSDERKKIIRALGGELVLTSAEASISGSNDRLEELKAEIPNHFVPGQFTNPNNPDAHYTTTGPEIWAQMEGKVDAFVAGVGSGGTLMGVGRFLREKNPRVQIIAVEPRNNSALLGKEPGLHTIQGIGDGFVPGVVDRSYIDMVMTVSDEDAIETARRLAREQGILVGTSSGANVWVASHFADGRRNVVTILADRAERYFSTA